jgi:hypothetical protein
MNEFKDGVLFSIQLPFSGGVVLAEFTLCLII